MKNIDSDKAYSDNSEHNTKHSPLKRLGAVLGLIFILFCLIGLFVNILSDGEARVTLMFLFSLIVLPAVFYVFLMTVRLVRSHNKTDG